MKKVSIEFNCPDDMDVRVIGARIHSRLAGTKDYEENNAYVLNVFDEETRYTVNLSKCYSYSAAMAVAKYAMDDIVGQMIEHNFSPKSVDLEEHDTNKRVCKLSKTPTPNDKTGKQESSNNPIKMDGQPASFAGGATRYTKTGKGRFDLIPGEIAMQVLTAAWEYYYADGIMTTSKSDILNVAFDASGPCPVLNFVDTIINMVNYIYTDGDWCCDDSGQMSKETCFTEFVQGFSRMLMELAKHYENGAERYGVDNWKKGIPVSGGNRGGSFADSMLRHLNQYMTAYEGHIEVRDDETETFVFADTTPKNYGGALVFDNINHQFYKMIDEISYIQEEPHHVAVLWNAFCALWYISRDPGKYNVGICSDEDIECGENTCNCSCCNCGGNETEEDTSKDLLTPEDRDRFIDPTLSNLMFFGSAYGLIRETIKNNPSAINLLDSLSDISNYILSTFPLAYDKKVIDTHFVTQAAVYSEGICELLKTISSKTGPVVTAVQVTSESIDSVKKESSREFNPKLFGQMASDALKNEIEWQDNLSNNTMKAYGAFRVLQEWRHSFAE